MLTYAKRYDGSYQVSIGNVVLGSMHKHIGVINGDPTYWEFNKVTGHGNPLQLRHGDQIPLKELVTVWVRRIIERGLNVD